MHTILVVDDDAPSREFLGQLLSYQGHRVIEAADGSHALRCAHAERPDLVISDILMPTMDGYEFVRQLRGDVTLNKTTVIFCSAIYHSQQARALAAACGVTYTISKPAEPEAVLEIVQAALSRTAFASPASVSQEFDREHLQLLTDKLVKKVAELEDAKLQNAVLFETTRQMACEDSSDRLLGIVCQAARKLTAARYACVGLVDPEKPALQSFIAAGVDAELAGRISAPATANGLLGQLLRSPRPLLIADVAGDPLVVGFPPSHAADRAFLGTPLNASGEIYGVLYLIEKLGARTFGNQDETVLENLAKQVSAHYERLRAQETIYVLRRAVESSHDLIGIADTKGKVTYVNPAFLRNLRASKQNIVGQHFHDILSPTNAKELNEEIGTKCFEPVGWKGECFFIRQDGTDLPVDLQTSSVRDERGRPFGSIGIAQDITERKKAQAELLTAKNAAEAADRAKSEFLANMSHEIRTPMNGISGMADLLLETELTPEQSEYLHILKDSADSLLAVIQAILDFSKLETQKLELENLTFDLRRVLEDAVKTPAARAQQKGLELIFNVDPDVPPIVVGDPARLRQIFINLMSNSLKFTDKGKIEADVRPESRNAERVTLRFRIRDTGIGIPIEKQRVIFDAFCQADSSTTRKYGGTGLGLAISAKIANLMGGRLWFESEVGKGSSFYFTAAVQVASPAMAAESLEPSRLPQRINQSWS